MICISKVFVSLVILTLSIQVITPDKTKADNQQVGIEINGTPNKLAMGKENKILYVLTEDNRIFNVDIKNDTVLNSESYDSGIKRIVVDDATGIIYAFMSNPTGSIQKIDPSSLRILENITFGLSPESYLSQKNIDVIASYRHSTGGEDFYIANDSDTILQFNKNDPLTPLPPYNLTLNNYTKCGVDDGILNLQTDPNTGDLYAVTQHSIYLKTRHGTQELKPIFNVTDNSSCQKLTGIFPDFPSNIIYAIAYEVQNDTSYEMIPYYIDISNKSDVLSAQLDLSQLNFSYVALTDLYPLTDGNSHKIFMVFDAERIAVSELQNGSSNIWDLPKSIITGGSIIDIEVNSDTNVVYVAQNDTMIHMFNSDNLRPLYGLTLDIKPIEEEISNLSTDTNIKCDGKDLDPFEIDPGVPHYDRYYLGQNFACNAERAAGTGTAFHEWKWHDIDEKDIIVTPQQNYLDEGLQGIIYREFIKASDGNYTRDAGHTSNVNVTIKNHGSYLASIFGKSFTFAEKYGNSYSVISLILVLLGGTIYSGYHKKQSGKKSGEGQSDKKFTKDFLSTRDLLTADATIIVGLLVLLTLSGIREFTGIQLQLTVITATIVFPFAVSGLLLLLKRSFYGTVFAVAGFSQFIISMTLITIIAFGPLI